MTGTGLVLHIPHASTYIPPSVRRSLLLSDAELQQELLRMTDAYTDELFQCNLPGVFIVQYPVSRLVVDPERFENDEREPMSRVGMGVVYTKTSEGRQLRTSPSPEEREALLAEYYRPHHLRLEQAVDAGLRDKHRCLIVDCHSFPSSPLRYELHQDPCRPDICIGTDPFHTPSEMVKTLSRVSAHEGFSVAVNRPFAGALVPFRFYRQNPRVMSVMIELNRARYMDESTGRKTNEFHEMRGVVRRLVECCLP